MKKLYLIYILFLILPIQADYVRTGPVMYENCSFNFVIKICEKWKPADSYLAGKKLYRFKTRYSDREITEVVNKNTICFSNTVPGFLYYRGEYVSKTDLIRFECRYVR